MSTTTFVRPRAGLGDLPERLRTQDCTIAYMGASVTVQKDGFRPRLHELLAATTGRAHRAVTAAFGATGTITGVFLMDDLVIRHRPDLALVEYATSDVVGTTPPELVSPALEGIVTKLRDIDCEPCFLYLDRSDIDLSASDAVAAYEQVADRHGVPSLDVGACLRSAASDGPLLRDVVHTTGKGSQLAAETIQRSLLEIPAGPRPPRVPAADGRFAGARLVPPSAGVLGGGPYVEERFRLVYPYLDLDEGTELDVAVGGALAGLLVVLGPHSGWIEVSAGSDTSEYLLWDEHCHYERLGSVIISPFARPGSTVRLRVSSRPAGPGPGPPKRLKLAGLMELQ